MPCGTPRTVRRNDLVLALAEWGGGRGAPVVLFHSLAAHCHWWDWTAPRLAAAGRRVIALDFRGHGASAHASPPAYTFDDSAGDAVGVLDALGITRALALMDRSAAERVASAMPRGTAVTLPNTFHHLVLDAPEAFVAAVDGWLGRRCHGRSP